MRTVTAAGIELIVVELCDRRHGLGNPIREWCFQSEHENYLYSNWQTRGSFFQLLSRAGADGQSICLRRKAVEEGLVTDAESIAMLPFLSDDVLSAPVAIADASRARFVPFFIGHLASGWLVSSF